MAAPRDAGERFGLRTLSAHDKCGAIDAHARAQGSGSVQRGTQRTVGVLLLGKRGPVCAQERVDNCQTCQRSFGAHARAPAKSGFEGPHALLNRPCVVAFVGIGEGEDAKGRGTSNIPLLVLDTHTHPHTHTRAPSVLQVRVVPGIANRCSRRRLPSLMLVWLFALTEQQLGNQGWHRVANLS
jgi:hypothetical protein